jgi:branched-chain amino acid transport system ATP-binding protein
MTTTTAPAGPTTTPALQLAATVFGYGSVPVTEALDLALTPGECFGIVGANGAGKSTLLRGITGNARVFSGDVRVEGDSVQGRSAWRRARMGVSLVPEGRNLFTELTVGDNINAGALTRSRAEQRDAEEQAYTLFPQLGPLRKRRAGVLSGGEQQMLAVARALAARPRLLLLDEPSLGLSPRAVLDLTASLRTVVAAGEMTVLVVEQSLVIVRDLCARAAIMQLGHLEPPGPTATVLSEESVREGFLRRGD